MAQHTIPYSTKQTRAARIPVAFASERPAAFEMASGNARSTRWEAHYREGAQHCARSVNCASCVG